jgi:RNA polymerase sigma-70 factor (ECF subfamily)
MGGAAVELRGQHVRADPASFESIYRAHHPAVWRLLRCMGVAPEALDDAVQECFLVVYRRVGTIDASRDLRPWILGVARRTAWRSIRAQRTRTRVLARVHDETRVVALDEAAEAREQLERVAAVLECMPLPQREVFVLAHIEDLTAPEIAEIVGVPLATVYSRLRLARARFSRAGATTKEAI